MGINLGSGKEHRVIDLANMVNRLTGNEGGPKFKELRVWQKGKDLAVYIYRITNIGDFAKDYGEEAGEEMILHYTKRGKLVKIEILDASKTVIDFLEPILSQKPLATAVTY